MKTKKKTILSAEKFKLKTYVFDFLWQLSVQTNDRIRIQIRIINSETDL